eukprot:5844277-Prymnesium_polylepis.1
MSRTRRVPHRPLPPVLLEPSGRHPPSRCKRLLTRSSRSGSRSCSSLVRRRPWLLGATPCCPKRPSRSLSAVQISSERCAKRTGRSCRSHLATLTSLWGSAGCSATWCSAACLACRCPCDWAEGGEAGAGLQERFCGTTHPSWQEEVLERGGAGASFLGCRGGSSGYSAGDGRAAVPRRSCCTSAGGGAEAQACRGRRAPARARACAHA